MFFALAETDVAGDWFCKIVALGFFSSVCWLFFRLFNKDVP